MIANKIKIQNVLVIDEVYKKAKDIFGWSAHYNLEQGLAITLKWFQNRLDNQFVNKERYII